MARTFIGELILRMKDDASGKAQTAAGKMESAMDRINRAAKRLGDAPWGGRFQSQLDKLGASARDLDHLRSSWDRLQASFAKDNLSKSMRNTQIAHWKNAASGHLVAMAAAARDAEKAQARMNSTFREALRLGLYAGGAGTLTYMGGRAAREGLIASAERRREFFRQDMAGISKPDQDKLFNKSEAIGMKYPSIPVTGIMEMARSAFSVMGDADRAGAILERMAESLVVMQSARGPDAAAQQLIGLIRGLDNLGANKDGQIGIDQMNEMIDAATRAAQVDPDFNPQGFFNFARATKTAGPALSMDFLARAPVYIQDMGDGTTGNSLAMGFRAFVLEAVGSAGGKKYLKERDRLGIRKNGQLVDMELFGSNPDEWVLKYLVPALQKDGVDLNNDNQISAAIGKLSGNSTATGFLTRILTQHEQTSRWLELMKGAMGPDAAINARFEDPFVGLAAFKSSIENLAAALVPIDTINAGLNGLADVINRLQGAWRNGDPLAKAGIAAGAGAGIFATWKGLSAIWALTTAGPALNSAAGALHLAAASLSGAGAAGKAGGAAAGASGVAGWAGARAAAIGTGLLTAWGTLVQSLGDTPGDTFEDQVRNQAKAKEGLQRLFGMTREEYDPFYKSEEQLAAQRRASTGGNPLQDAVDNATRLGGGPVLDTTSLEEARQKATEAEQAIASAASVSGTPTIDTSNLERALRLANEFKAALREAMADAKSVSAPSGNSVTRQMNRNFTDHGVVP